MYNGSASFHKRYYCPNRMTGNRGWQSLPDVGQWQPVYLWVLCVLLSSPWTARCLFWHDKAVPCVCFRPQQPWPLDSSMSNLHLDLKFTLGKGKDNICKGKRRSSSRSVPLVSCSHAAPLPDFPQFESNHRRPIGCAGHVTYLGPKSAAFSDWSGIFPMGAAYRAGAATVCVCLRTLGKNLPPTPAPPLLYLLSTIPPFSLLFFSTTSHPLKHSITL